MDSQQGVCLFFQRTGTCKAGDKCPLSHAREQRGITTKYDDRIWQHAQASTSETQQAQQARRRRSSSAFAQAQQEAKDDKHEQQTAKWDFRVMTYNILAEGLATAHGELLYQQVPTWCLKWNYRWPGLLAEIVHYKPDVMSLQEVDHFDELAARLEPLGYEGRYAQRSGGRSDGCATFWRKDIFIAVAVDIIRFQSYGLQDNVALLVLLHRKAAFSDGEDTASDGVVEVRMTVDESGDVSMLSGEVNKWFRLHAEVPVDTLMDPALLVANTHILFNPKRGDIKIAQLRTLLNVMNDIVRKCNNNALGMVMGDFNSTPESAVYQFIRAGELDCQTVPRKHVSGQVQGTSWPAALEKMARQRSAPAALSIQSLERLITPPATPSSPQRSEFWGSPPQKSPTHRNPRKKRGPGVAAGTGGGLSRGMKHVASEPQLFAMDGSGDHAGMSRSTVEPLKLTAHTVPVQQTLPDTEPPLASSSAGSPRQPDSAPPAPHSAFGQRPQLAQRPSSMTTARDPPLSPSTAARIAEAVHKNDASLLDGAVIPSISSQRDLSTTSLSTIAESGSDVGNSQADLAALDQVADKLCELSAADSMHSDDTDARTDRSSFEFPTKKDPYASSPAQVSGFPSPSKLRSSPLGRHSGSLDSASQTQRESAAAEADASVLENGNTGADAFDNAPEAGFSSAPSADSSASSSSDSGIYRQTEPGSGSQLQNSFSIKDSALFAPTALKPRTVSQELAGESDIKSSGRKLQQIPSDSEIVIHASPGQGHETPFTSGPYTCKGSDPCPTLPASPKAAVSARAAAAAAAAAALAGEETQRQSEGLPRRPFSPPSLPVLAESSSELPSDCPLEQRTSSSSILSPTSKAAADALMFSPRRLPPKLTHTRISGFGDGPRLSGDSLHGSGDRSRGDKPPVSGDVSGRPSSERPRFSGERPRLSKDGPPIVRKPLFRDDSCTWSPEQLQMAVGGPPLQDYSTQQPEGETLTRAESAGSPGRTRAGVQDPEPTWVARHPLKLRSAYSQVTGSEPPYTTCHSKFLGTVDYMWYTPQADKGTTLVPTKTLVPPPLEHLYCGLPSPEWQSDHMSLVTDFSVQRRVSKNSILLSGLHKEANMVRARSKLVDSEVFEAAMVNRNRKEKTSK